ncbi:acetyl xylan esterase [Cordyceps militaris]|uniref:Acetyl xylan esterase n=1 Tax=Cordyceps militaris TaxID=73501 RepID=A0A2H4S770_CORMI|nr:acetyl xylan esterase [Cordyceps militaris]
MVHALRTLAALAGLAAAAAPTEQPRAACAAGVYMLVARGTNEDAGEGVSAQVSALVAARVPGSASVAVDYPATALKHRRRSVVARVFYPASVSQGISDAKKKIQDYVAQCGDGSRIALIGFSQGGNVMTDLLAGGLLQPAPLDAKYLKNIVAVTVFGDPTFAPNQSYNYGSNANGKGGLFSRKNNAAELARLNAISDKLASYCDTGDVFCAFGSETGGSNVHGNEVPAHAQEAADFIVARLQ